MHDVSPDRALLDFTRAHAVHEHGGADVSDAALGAVVVDGHITELDLRAMSGALDYFNEKLVEALRHVEVLTVGDVMISTLDLSGFTKLRELRLGSVGRGLWLNVSECGPLTFTLVPCAFEEGYTTNVLCRANQLSESVAAGLERKRKGSSGASLLFTIIGRSGPRRVTPHAGEVFGWMSRHDSVELATILRSYWSECPWTWAGYGDEASVPTHMRGTFRRMRDVESRVARGFYRSRTESFDAATEPYLEKKDPLVTYLHEIPACMFVV
jgi:hypothetical protein